MRYAISICEIRHFGLLGISSKVFTMTLDHSRLSSHQLHSYRLNFFIITWNRSSSPSSITATLGYFSRLNISMSFSDLGYGGFHRSSGLPYQTLNCSRLLDFLRLVQLLAAVSTAAHMIPVTLLNCGFEGIMIPEDNSSCLVDNHSLSTIVISRQGLFFCLPFSLSLSRRIAHLPGNYSFLQPRFWSEFNQTPNTPSRIIIEISSSIPLRRKFFILYLLLHF